MSLTKLYFSKSNEDTFKWNGNIVEWINDIFKWSNDISNRDCRYL